MGCVASRLKDEEAVRLCRDRRNHIKNAVEHRDRFAACHVAYIDSLRRMSTALHRFVAGDDDHALIFDSLVAAPFGNSKRMSPDVLAGIPFKSLLQTPKKYRKPTMHTTVHVSRYLQSGPSPSVSVEEWPSAHAETVMQGFAGYGMYNMRGDASPMRASQYYTPPYDHRDSYVQPSLLPPHPPQESPWDFFWNPFSALDNYGYLYPPPRYSYDNAGSEDEMARIRRVREEEGIPELEEEESEEREIGHDNVDDEKEENEDGEDVDDVCDDMEEEVDDADEDEEISEVNFENHGHGQHKTASEHHPPKAEPCSNAMDIAGVRGKGHKSGVVRNMAPRNANEPPGFTVYVNSRPMSMAEVTEEICCQFARICDAAEEVSVMLEASRSQNSNLRDLSASGRMMNHLGLLRSASPHLGSSRFLLTPSSGRDESSSLYSEDTVMISGSHQSTLDRLYTWEKKLYKEVKIEECLRREYERKLMQFRSQDNNGEQPAALDRTREALRSLDTQLSVSMHSVECISRRIEVLTDEELHPQLVELIRGLELMWQRMAECHWNQKRAIDRGKLLFLNIIANGTTKQFNASRMPSQASVISGAIELEFALRAWRGALEAWIASQRAYAGALGSWARCCAGRSSNLPPPVPALAICVEWAQAVQVVSEARVMDGLDFFTAGMSSVRTGAPEEPEATGEWERMAPEMAMRVLCAGVSVASGALSEFTASMAQSHARITRRGAPLERAGEVGGGSSAA